MTQKMPDKTNVTEKSQPLYRYDTHVHTAETSPCGKVPASELVRMYRDAGYCGIVITDHYFGRFFRRLLFKSWERKADTYLAGYRIAAEEGCKLGIDVILGMEIKFDGDPNDYLVYGIDEKFLKENRELYKVDLESFRSLAVQNDLLIVQAHPFRPYMVPARPDLIDGVEVYNGNPRHDSRNQMASAYAEENKLLATSGSDFHQPQDLARGGILVPMRIDTPSSLVNAIRGSHDLIYS